MTSKYKQKRDTWEAETDKAIKGQTEFPISTRDFLQNAYDLDQYVKCSE